MNPRRVVDLLYKEIRGLHEVAYLLAFFTFGSQLFALARDRLLAHQFGAGETLDIFYAAFRIPDTMYTILASMVSIFVLIPFLESATQRGQNTLREFMSSICTFFSSTLITLGIVVYFFTPQIVSVLYENFSPTMQTSLVDVVRILLLQPLFLGVSNLFAAYVQTRGRFLLYAIAPILYNIGVILGILFFYPYMGVVGLAWGVVLGALLHLGIQMPFMMANQMIPKILIPKWRTVYEVMRISIPRTITLSSQQLVVLVMISLASRYVAGSVSAFSFAWNLQAVPLAIIGVSYSVAAFPKLSRLYNKGEYDEYIKLVVVAARQIIFWAIPTTVFIIILRAQIVRVVLGTGAFDWSATKMTAAILALLTLSLVAQGLIILLVRACYAAGKTRVPLVINVMSSFGTILFAYALLQVAHTNFLQVSFLANSMRVAGADGAEVLLIALAYTLGSILNALLLLLHFSKMYTNFFKDLRMTIIQALIASIIAGYGTYLALHLLLGVVSQGTFLGIFKQGFVAGVVGGCLWTATLIALGNSDIITAWTTLQKRLLKMPVKEARGPIPLEGSNF